MPLLLQGDPARVHIAAHVGGAEFGVELHDPCHAFRWGEAAWGVQFHPEFSATHMRGYVHARRVALQQEGHCPKTITRNVRAAPEARRVLKRFVHHVRGLPRR